jgi:hypothetical protein
MSFRYLRVKAHEALRLRRKAIETDNAFWSAAGEDFDRGLENLATRTRVQRDRLIEILADGAIREPEPGVARWRRWIARHALDLFVLGGVALLLALVLRAEGRFSNLPAPWGLRQRMPVLVYGLGKDKVFRDRDFAEVWLNPRHDQFTKPRQLNGLRAARPLEAGSILRYSDVQREQVVALRDIPQGSVVPANAVARRWSVYEPDAVLQVGLATGHQALRSIRRDEVIGGQDLGPAPRLPHP